MITAERTTHDRRAATDRTHQLLVAAAEADDKHTRSEIEDQIVREHMNLVRSAAARYARRGAETDDLVQVGCVALVKAMRGFELGKGDFVSYARATILGEIKRHFRDSCWAVRPPRRLQELQAEVSATVEDRIAATRQEPTTAEIAIDLGVESRDVREALAAGDCYSLRSLDHPTGISGRSLGDTVAAEGCDYDFVDEWATVSPLCRELDEADLHMLVLRFVDDRTQREIGAELGISQMQVSRRLRRVLDHLRDGATESED